MVQISGVVVLVVAASTLFYVLLAIFRARRRLERTLSLLGTDDRSLLGGVWASKMWVKSVKSPPGRTL